MEILQQIGQLVLGSVPTMLLFLFLWLVYRLLVHSPLTRMLEQRREQTEGAMEKARQAIAAAETKTEDYENKVRAARKSIQSARENQMQQWNLEREKALTDVRQTSQQRVQQARADIQASTDESMKTIERSSHELAAQIVAHLLAPSARPAERAH